MKRIPAFLTLAVVSAAAIVYVQSTPAAAPAPGGRGGGGGPGGGPAAATQPLTLTKVVPDGKLHKFETKNKQFIIDGEPTVLIAGEMHFGRILPEDFETRVKQAKAMGLNTISFYLFWNLVEPQPGQFDFTGMNDVHRMLKICQDNGMWAILRPGPYCCAEVEYGGIPYWTAKSENTGAKIRTSDPKWLEWSKRYIERVGKEVADMQVTKGGPLLMVQMENEFSMVAGASGGYGYMHELETIFKGAGFDVPLMVCDPGGTPPAGPSGYPEDVLRGRNGLGPNAGYVQAANALGDLPLYAPEIYTAWFAGWGQPLPTRHTGIPEVANATTYFLDHNVSWCYYVFFGGTNWGYNTGCNEFLPLQTTYDYSAPVDEAGRTNDKFRALRAILTTKTGRTLPEPPAEPVVGTLQPINFTEHETLLEWMPKQATKAEVKPVSMEDLNQDYGFVDYRKTFPNGIHGTLELRQARDYAVTMVNGKTVGKSFIGLGAESNKITLDEAGPVTLDILVHNLGRISVITSANSQERARKGLIGGAYLDGTELADWQSFSLPLASVENFKASATAQTGPAFHHATFNVDKPVSTFLNLSNFSMGVVWVNGHNLGRFWDRGAARSLFCSEHFLKAGANEITVLELGDAPKTPQIASTTTMVTSAAVPFVIALDNARAGGAGPAAGRRGAPGTGTAPGRGAGPVGRVGPVPPN